MTFPQARPVELAGRACPTSVGPDGREDGTVSDQDWGDWGALAAAVRDRRLALGLRQGDLEALGGPSQGTVKNIEQSARTKYAQRTFAQLETALGWPHGAVARILSGDSEPEMDEGGATPDRAEEPALQAPNANGQPCACVVGSPAWVERELATERRINALARVFQEEMTRLLALVDAARKANGD